MNENPIQEFLSRQGFVMLDGGLATEMEKRGADLDNDLWSAKALIESPEIIRLVHTDFLRAGADVIATASYPHQTNAGLPEQSVPPSGPARNVRQMCR